MPDLTTPFGTLLVANRGEIAVRILRTARAMGLATVAVYSDADAGALHTRLADRAVRIGPAPAGESYLDIARLIDAARRSGADAVHPGYGFLSERADFAAACREARLVFVGPSVSAIVAMGDKSRAKAIAKDCGVPCVPGYDGASQDEAELIEQAGRVGYPLMVKAIAGGGGKGMRLVASPQELQESLRAARSEALKAFGDGSLMFERAIVDARHIEVQVFGDRHGAVVHLGDRDCSIQRRHQKVIEEAPAPGLADASRAGMRAAAIALARAVDYEGAGTVEFLLTGTGDFFFLEMNTRLQVEHPVTEAVTGLDLVEWQIRVARGEALPLTQDAVRIHGHAIEARVYAEDPAASFLPQSGGLTIWQPPEGPGIRVDHGLAVGDTITTFYDPMIAKVVASGADRESARRGLIGALERTCIGGLRNNLGFLRECLRHSVFAEGRMHTGFIDGAHFAATDEAAPPAILVTIAAVLFETRSVSAIDPELRHWQSRPTRPRPLLLESGAWLGCVVVAAEPDGTMRVDGVATVRVDAVRGRATVDGIDHPLAFAWTGDTLDIVCGSGQARFAESRPQRDGQAAAGTAVIVAPMPGSIVDVRVALGAEVLAGDVLLVLEAMKMETHIQTPVAGRVERLEAAAGQQVALRQVLACIVATGE